MIEPAADAETGEVSFEHGGRQYRAVMDMAAIRYFEVDLGLGSIVDAQREMGEALEAGRSPKVSMLAYMMHAGLRRHHPEVSPEQAFRMACDSGVQAALGMAMRVASPGDDQPEDPPKAPAKRARSTSTRSSSGRSRRD